MCRRWRNTTLKPGSRRPHLWARWATSCARGWKRPIMSTRGPASSRFSLTMNESSFDRRPAHATDRSGPAVFDAMVPSDISGLLEAPVQCGDAILDRVALAPPAEPSPAPEIFFQKRPPSERLPPFKGAETVFGQVFGRGA